MEAEIRFELRLPTTAWNGKLCHRDGSGFVGAIPLALTGLERGYATVATDTGHVGDSSDASWALGRPDRQLSWAHRSNVAGFHVAAVRLERVSHDRRRVRDSLRSCEAFGGVWVGVSA